MNNSEENFMNSFLELLFDIFNTNNESLSDNRKNEFEKGNFDLLWNENHEKEKGIFDGYEDFKSYKTTEDNLSTTKLEK